MGIVILLAFLAILYSLTSALVHLMRDKGGSNHTVRALTWRIGLSILLFLFILVAHQLGWIDSTGVPMRAIG